MKIGIIGLGVVGSACEYGFKKLGHEVLPHDLRLETSIDDVLPSSICYICVYWQYISFDEPSRSSHYVRISHNMLYGTVRVRTGQYEYGGILYNDQQDDSGNIILRYNNSTAYS